MISFRTDGPIPADPAKTHVAKDLAHDRPLICCRFDPAGKYAFAGSEDESIVRFDLETGAKTVLKGHESWVFALDATPDGQTLLSGAGDGRLIWWPAMVESPTPRGPSRPTAGWINHLTLSHDGSLIATCGNDRMVRLWKTSDGSPAGELPGHEKPVYRVLFEPSGTFLLTADLQGRVIQWELATSKEVRRFDAAKLYSYNGGQQVDYGGVRDFSLSADGKSLACSGLIEASNPLGAVSNPAVVVFDWASGAGEDPPASEGRHQGGGLGVEVPPSRVPGCGLGRYGRRTPLVLQARGEERVRHLQAAEHCPRARPAPGRPPPRDRASRRAFTRLLDDPRTAQVGLSRRARPGRVAMSRDDRERRRGGWTRRSLLRVGGLAALGLDLPGLLRARAVAAPLPRVPRTVAADPIVHRDLLLRRPESARNVRS